MQDPRSHTCCFSGYRPGKMPFNVYDPAAVRALEILLDRAIDRAVAEGYDSFWSGMALGFDIWAAEAVIRRKINALPPETFPLRIGPRVQLRRAHNRGLLCSKLADRPKAAAALQTASAAVLASMTAVCVFRRSSAVLQVAMGLMLGGALANLVERWARGAVTDYVYLPRAVIPFFRRIIWNVADLSVFAGCLVAIGVLACEAV